MSCKNNRRPKEQQMRSDLVCMEHEREDGLTEKNSAGKLDCSSSKAEVLV